MPTCHAYARVSTHMQQHSLEAQTVALKGVYRQRYEARGYAWRGMYADEDFSGSLDWFSRPAGRKLLSSLEPGDAIIATKLDRISRSALDWHRMVKGVLPGLHIDIHVGDIDLELTKPSGRMMAAMMVTFAEYERELIAERTRVGIHHKRNTRCEWFGGTVPWGWRVNRDHKLIPHHPERDVLKAMLEHKRTSGLSFISLWQQVYRGHKCPRGKPWAQKRVEYAIRAADRGFPLKPHLQRFTLAAALAKSDPSAD